MFSSTGLSALSKSENQWPQPELSLGAPYGSLDILARYKFWEVKNNSPAHQAWRAVSEQIINLIEDQFEALDVQETDLMFFSEAKVKLHAKEP
ncbi:hypothetical protein LHYA1_G004332 [Lachnellula hyalina]|uniref:Uncharacterized protein n=1 Tax=Lachnellula hyalina TaxID=1316788 RepID=A0A8H8U0V7_9HELO|nr:uncharacterized protein LHYA1_G004332 [Lachnellula hyalina]TVY27730.1 hypothetical protein LHYA1_G004332 [Lachnellula hyalina]